MALLRGSSRADILNGGNGNDSIYGLGGNDRLSGGGGNDLLVGGSGADVLNGNDGDDRFDLGTPAQSSGDAVNGGAGLDTLQITFALQSAAIDFRASSGSVGGAAYTGIERFFVTGGRAADRFVGGDGNDHFVGGAGGDSMAGGDGDDVLEGGSGADTMRGGRDDDTLITGTRAEAEGDVVDGGSGRDTLQLSFADSVRDLNITLASGAATARTLGGVSYVNVENFHVSGGSGNDRIRGGDGDDVIAGGAGNDRLTAGAGADVLRGGAGDDTLTFGGGHFGHDTVDGGTGNDTLVLTFWEGGTFVESAAGVVTLADGTRVSGVENFDIDTDFANNTITLRGGNDHVSSGLNDVVDTGDGNDVIESWHGSDDVRAGNGDDSVTMRYDGTDRADGGAGDDLLVVDAGPTYPWATLPALGDLTFRATGAAATLAGGTVTAQYANFERFEITGGNGDDSLAVGGGLRLIAHGGAGNDTLRGSTGVDRLEGGDGNDAISGGGGDDVLDGGAGDDRITLVHGALAVGGTGVDRVTVDFAGRADGVSFDFLASGLTYVDGDTAFSGMESLRFIGTAAGDKVSGSTASDTFTGGGGADTWVWRTLPTVADVVTDFTRGQDHLQFSRAALGLDTGESAGVVNGTRPVGRAAQFYFVASTHALWFDENGTGSGGKTLIATLDDVTSLAASDFIFV